MTRTTYCYDSYGNELFEDDLVEFNDFRCAGDPVIQSQYDGSVRVRAKISFKDGRFFVDKKGLNDGLLAARGKEKYDRWLPYVYEVWHLKDHNCRRLINL